MAPAQNSRASASVVFPAPPCPTRATLRILAAGKLFNGRPSRLVESGAHLEPTGQRSADRVRPVAGKPLVRVTVTPSLGAHDVRRTLADEHRAGPAARRRQPPPHRPHRRPPHRARPASLAVAAAVAIGNGALRGGLLLLIARRPARPARRRRGQGVGHGVAPRGAFFDSVADRVTDALSSAAWPGTSPSVDGGHWRRSCRSRCSAPSTLISYERAKAESLGFDARGGLMERAERIIAAVPRPAVRLAAGPDACG